MNGTGYDWQVCSESFKEIDNARFEIHIAGNVVDPTSIISDCGLSHNDAVSLELIPDPNEAANAKLQEATSQIQKLSESLEKERALSADLQQQLAAKDALIAQQESELQQQTETIAQLQQQLEEFSALRARRQARIDAMEQRRAERQAAAEQRAKEMAAAAAKSAAKSSKSSKSRSRAHRHHRMEEPSEPVDLEWQMPSEDEREFTRQYYELDFVDLETLRAEMADLGADDASIDAMFD